MNKLKYTIPGQMLLLVKSHLSTAVLFLILFLFTFSMTAGTGIGSIIYASVGILGYFLSIYSTAGSYVSCDKMPSSKLSPHPAKGFILPVILTAVSLVIILFYKLAWAYGSNGTSVTEIWSFIANALMLIWVAPYQPFVGLSAGNITTIGYLIILVLPYIASGLGYLATYKGFDLSEKVRNIAYEKKNNDK